MEFGLNSLDTVAGCRQSFANRSSCVMVDQPNPEGYLRNSTSIPSLVPTEHSPLPRSKRHHRGRDSVRLIGHVPGKAKEPRSTSEGRLRLHQRAALIVSLGHRH